MGLKGNLSVFFESKMKIVDEMGKNFSEYYNNRCSLTTEKCSFFECSSKYHSISCNSKLFNNIENFCSLCYKENPNIDSKNSFVIISPYADNPSDQSSLELIIAGKNLEKNFIHNLNDEYIKWQYFGTYNGIFRNYPGLPQCGSTYDNRFRPWYVHATTGSKNVVIVFDFSGSMYFDTKSGKQRQTLAKEAAQILIQTLTRFDNLGFIFFNSEAYYYRDTLISVSNTFKSEILEFISTIFPTGYTNFQDAFNKTFLLFENTAKLNKINSCSNNVIIFMTDGKINRGGEEAGIINMIKKENVKYNATIFSYSFGEYADEVIPKKIACMTNGFWQRVNDGENLGKTMAIYYKFLAAGIENKKPIITEPYIDHYGIGLITTMAKAVYNKDKVLLGVIGIDVSLKHLLSQGFNENDINKAIIEKLEKKCSNFNLNICDIENLRVGNSKCGIKNCSNNGKNLLLWPKKCDNNVFFEKADKNKNMFCEKFEKEMKIKKCCGDNICDAFDNKVRVSMISTFSIVFLCLILVCVYKIYKFYKLKKKVKRFSFYANNPNTGIKNFYLEETDKKPINS